MAEFRLALGTVVDVATSDEVQKALDTAVTGLQGHIDSRMMVGKHPIRRVLAASTTLNLASGATFQLTLEPQKPAMGRMWSARRLTVTGGSDNATVTNLTAAFYVGDPVNFTLGQLVAPGIAMPFANFFSSRSVPIRDQEAAFINFTASGVITAQQVQATLLVEEWDDRAAERQHA